MNKKQYTLSIFLLVFALSVIPPESNAAEPSFRQLTVKDGLSTSIAYYVVQDSQGYMWISTNYGLNRYDGYGITVFRHDSRNPGSLSYNVISKMFVDSRGDLWVGTYGGGLNRFNRETESFTRYPHEPGQTGSLGGDTVNAMFEDSKQRFWVGTLRNGLYLMDRDTGTFKPFKMPASQRFTLVDDHIMTIFEDSKGRLWIGTMGGGLKRFHPETGDYENFFRGKLHRDNLLPNCIAEIIEDKHGNFWIGTFKGLMKFDGSRFLDIDYPELVAAGFQDERLYSLHFDRRGELWISTQIHGLGRLNLETGHLNMFLEDEFFIKSMYVDRSGLVWASTAGHGVVILDPKGRKFKHSNFEAVKGSRTSRDSIFSIFINPSSPDILWLGTMGNGLVKTDLASGKTNRYKVKNAYRGNLAGNFIQSIFPEKSGKLWIGTNGAGLNQFDPKTGTFKRYPFFGGVLKSSLPGISRIGKDRSGRLWIGTVDSGIVRFDPITKKTAFYHTDPGNPNSLSNNTIFSIFRDRGGTMWVGTEAGGLNKFDPDSGNFTRYLPSPGKSNSLSSSMVTCIYEDRRGVLWIGTDYGINRFNPRDETFTVYGLAEGMANEEVLGILEDKTGKLWICTENSGISQFDPFNETFRNFTVDDDLQENEFVTGVYCKSPSGELFFGGMNGIYSFFPKNVTGINPTIPKTQLTGFRLFNKPVRVGESINNRVLMPRGIRETKSVTLSYRENMFSFEFTGLEFSNPRKNKYAYKMENFHPDWIYTDAGNRTAAFTSLEPGEYIFRVKSSNNDGVWDETGTSVKVIITPPFWKTLWFRIGMVMILCASAVFLHRKRLEKLRYKLKRDATLEQILAKFNISLREKEVIDLLLEGKTNKDIEEKLFISPHTVKNHLYRIYRKVDVKSRSELITRVNHLFAGQ